MATKKHSGFQKKINLPPKINLRALAEEQKNIKFSESALAKIVDAIQKKNISFELTKIKFNNPDYKCLTGFREKLKTSASINLPLDLVTIPVKGANKLSRLHFFKLAYGTHFQEINLTEEQLKEVIPLVWSALQQSARVHEENAKKIRKNLKK